MELYKRTFFANWVNIEEGSKNDQSKSVNMGTQNLRSRFFGNKGESEIYIKG